MRFPRNHKDVLQPRSRGGAGVFARHCVAQLAGVLFLVSTVPVLAQTAETGASLPPLLPNGMQRAFPTAEGHGAAAVGGRGGQVMFVTTLEEGGPGSLRSCVEATGPRTCIFRIGGTITLDKASLVVRHPYLTIAGESAPGDGIAIRNGPRQVRPSLEVKAHDIIVRHVRFRPGPHEVEACCSGAVGIYTKAAKDVIFDHISASWGSDETFDSADAQRLTVQWGIFSEPLLDGGPGKSNRARNMLLWKGGDFSVHHNLFAFGKFRNPQLVPDVPGTTIEVVNNVLYSPEWQYVVTLVNRWAKVAGNIVGNVKFSGGITPFFWRHNDRLVHFAEEGPNGFEIYLENNWDEDYRTSDGVPEEMVVARNQRHFLTDQPVMTPLVRADPPMTAHDAVLMQAGATRPKRDAVDERIVLQVQERRGDLLGTNPADVGGWPDLETGPVPADADDDGMSDAWETRFGLDPSDAADGPLDKDGDGWTNLEEYLHELAGDGIGMVEN